MSKFAVALIILGVVCVIVGLFGLLSKVLAFTDVNFIFSVKPWYGPFFGGIVLVVAGWLIRLQQNSKSTSPNIEPWN